jgi:exonuclease III
MKFRSRAITFILSITVALLGTLVTHAHSADRRVDKNALTIMTYNAEFLFDGVLPDGSASVDFPWKGSPEEAEDHMSKVAAVISAYDPDIVNLVEVENLKVLQHILDKYLAGHNYRAYLVEGTATQTGQNVGILTRVDPPDSAVYRWDDKGKSGSTNKSVSKNYYANIPINNLNVWFVGLHFLAQPNRADRQHPREAQADAIRALIESKRSVSDQIVVWGDFNDYDGICSDLQDHKPITAVLEILKKLNSLSNTDDLQNAVCVGNVPSAERYTAWWDANDDGQSSYPAEFSSIDHILLSDGLARYVNRVEIAHTMLPGAVSDHFPVIVHFRFGPLSPGAGPSEGIYIAAVMANPQGDERQEEAVWIENGTDSALSLSGWRVRDRTNSEWVLDDADGTVPAGKRLEVKRRGRLMAINNSGDQLSLIDASGIVRHVVDVGRSGEGEIQDFMH